MHTYNISGHFSFNLRMVIELVVRNNVISGLSKYPSTRIFSLSEDNAVSCDA